MRALIYDGEHVRLDPAAAAPEPLPDHAIVRLKRALISNHDLAIARGDVPHTGILGQRFVGVVESIAAAGSSRVQPTAILLGKRVTASITTACGKCKRCASGLSRHCESRRVFGMNGYGGCFAERFNVHISSLAPVPEQVDDDHAVFAVDTASAIQAVSQLTIEGKPYITVLGDNALAMLCAQVMSKLNASVRVIGFDERRLVACEKWGIKHRLATETGLRADQDVVVDCSGTTDGLSLAMKMVRPRGKILVKQLRAPSLPPGESTECSAAAPSHLLAACLDLSPLVLNEIELLGSFAGPVAQAVDLLARSEVDVLGLISKRMSLKDGVAAMQQAAGSGVVSVLLEP